MDPDAADLAGAYKRHVAEIAALETAARAAGEKQALLDEHYGALLAALPWLEGFWVRWAHTTFAARGVQAADAIFVRALSVPYLARSPTLWTEYLRFRTHLVQLQRPVSADVLAVFARAEKLVGSHFLAHPFWDLYLEVHGSPLELLQHIVGTCTLHQATKYYQTFCERLATASYAEIEGLLRDSEHVSKPRGRPEGKLAGNSDGAPEDADVARLREVVGTRLRVLYLVHLRRVQKVMPFELKIKRPFFYPKVVTSADLETWSQYILSLEPGDHDARVVLFERALIPCAMHAPMWLFYLRYLVQHSPQSMDAVYAAGKHLAAVRKHEQLWRARSAPPPEPTDFISRLELLRRRNAAEFLQAFAQLSREELLEYYRSGVIK